MTSDAPASSTGDPRDPVRPNPVGVAALVVGAVDALVGAALSVAQPAVISSGGGARGVALVAAIGAVVVGLLGVLALVLGLVGLLLPARRRGAAAAGSALGAVLLLQTVVGLLAPAVVGLLAPVLHSPR